jgi:hypothetical protein
MYAYNHPSVQQARRLFRNEVSADADFPAPCRGCGQFARHHGDRVIDRNTGMRNALARAGADRDPRPSRRPSPNHRVIR